MLSVFLQDKMKWLPQVKMNEADSVAFITKAVVEWNNLSENEKSSFEEKYKHLRKDFKNKIKEFIMVGQILKCKFLIMKNFKFLKFSRINQ